MTYTTYRRTAETCALELRLFRVAAIETGSRSISAVILERGCGYIAVRGECTPRTFYFIFYPGLWSHIARAPRSPPPPEVRAFSGTVTGSFHTLHASRGPGARADTEVPPPPLHYLCSAVTQPCLAWLKKTWWVGVGVLYGAGRLLKGWLLMEIYWRRRWGMRLISFLPRLRWKVRATGLDRPYPGDTIVFPVLSGNAAAL